ncbi:MAG: peptidoglycan DD-metalloendopeptidase family protein [Chlorobi bacterium]|nr:peptidoglycan DD-metalloendopeptidase family protein [Chlorobiota bacterium]
MNKKITYGFILFILFGISFSSFGQSKKLLKAQKDLQQAKTLLTSLNKKSEVTYLKYQVLTKQIKFQKVLLNNIKTEIDSLDKLISVNTQNRNKLKKTITSLKKEYEELIFYAYKTRNTRDKTIYIFSAKTFNQAYRRFVYLQYLTEYLEETTTDLKVKADSLSLLNEDLFLQKNEKLELKEKQTDELLQLNSSKKILDNILDNLINKKEQLLKEIRKKEKIFAVLRKSIKKVSGNTKITKTKLSLTFEKNKGKLPFPAKGIITSTFGKHKHAVLKNIEVNNDGIDIATELGENAKAVFKGKVVQVLKIPGANKAVIVKHGQYYSVYSNLNEVFVSKGQSVKVGEALGKPDSRILNFQIWYRNKKLNPQRWLRK